METLDIKLFKNSYNTIKAQEYYESDREKGLEYVKRYFFKTTNPVGVMFYNSGLKNFEYYALDKAIEAYIPNACYYHGKESHKLIKEFRDYKNPYCQTVEINKPIFYKENGINYLNTFMGLPKMFDIKMKYEEFDDETKSGVEFILKHLHDVWCSKDEKTYEYVKNWIINMITLHRNETALYLKSIQGTGKSSITDFLLDFLGSNLGYFSSSPDVIMNFNAPLKGKILFVLEEMPASSVSEWKAYNARLKSYILNPLLDINDKYIPRSTVPNLLNLIINSNENAIKLDNSDRRYVCLDISSEKVGNIEYFEKLHKYLRNDDVKKCFYAYCNENYDKNFNPRKIPITKTKTDLLSNNMDEVIKYIKEEYLLKGSPINITFKKFYENFAKEAGRDKKKFTSINVLNTLNDYKITIIEKGHEAKRISMTYNELYEYYKSRNLINDADKDRFVENEKEDKKFDDFEDEESSKDKSNPIIEEQKSIIDKQTKEIEELKKQLEELKKQIPKTGIEVAQGDFDNLTVKKVDRKHKISEDKLKKMCDYDVSKSRKDIEIKESKPITEDHEKFLDKIEKIGEIKF